ncbi:MAG: hypothetical protein GC178_14160 [Flavobacteriales bacterium]|nr:hypothetical protein [Flavobacteriales bacterium]
MPRSMEEYVAMGKRVVVQFGRRKLYTGIISEVHHTPPQHYQAKYLEDLLDDAPVVLSGQMAFWSWMAEYYLCHVGDAMNAAIPSGLKLSSESRLAALNTELHDANGIFKSNSNPKTCSLS